MKDGDNKRRLKDLTASLSAVNRQAEGNSLLSTSLPPVALVNQEREQVRRLLEALHRYAGLAPSDVLARKVLQLLPTLTAEQRAAWLAVDKTGADPATLRGIAEKLTNHETFFFRDQDQLKLLRDVLLPEALEARSRLGQHVLRLWSAACSTGEEAYTLAMLGIEAMLAKGIAQVAADGAIRLLHGWRLEILGTDLSTAALSVARTGSYRNDVVGSFRQFPESQLRFFSQKPVAGLLQDRAAYICTIKASLASLVRFSQANLLEPAPARDFDFIACRNVLIYIDSGLHADVQRNLADALRPGGALMLSHVDLLQPGVPLTVRRVADVQVYVHE